MLLLTRQGVNAIVYLQSSKAARASDWDGKDDTSRRVQATEGENDDTLRGVRAVEY